MKKPGAPDALLFDVTGTLVDMSRSQVAAITQTVDRWLGAKDAVSVGQVQPVRQSVGYNNEWDTTYAVTRLLEQGVPPEEWAERAQALLPIDRTDPQFQRLRSIFQTLYLGSERYAEFEDVTPPFENTEGLIALETSFVTGGLLAELIRQRGYKLGVATGCPMQEACYSLDRQDLLGSDRLDEQFVVGLEDTKRTKPYPGPLLEAARRLDAERPLYFGDNLSDIEAARSAGMPCVYVGGQAAGAGAEESLITRVLRSLL
jgi:HAD superfamily phosphatase